MTCNLKPGTKVCISAINSAKLNPTCESCPAVEKIGGAVCESDKPTTRTKKTNALTAILRVKTELAEAKKIKNEPPEMRDGTGHLSTTKAIAHSTEPANYMRVKTIGSGHASHGFVN